MKSVSQIIQSGMNKISLAIGAWFNNSDVAIEDSSTRRSSSRSTD